MQRRKLFTELLMWLILLIAGIVTYFVYNRERNSNENQTTEPATFIGGIQEYYPEDTVEDKFTH